MRPVGALIFGGARRSLRPSPAAHSLRLIFLRCHPSECIRSKLRHLCGSESAVQHRHGRVLGRGRVSGGGECPTPTPRTDFRFDAEWLPAGILAGCGGHGKRTASSWLAGNVLCRLYDCDSDLQSLHSAPKRIPSAQLHIILRRSAHTRQYPEQRGTPRYIHFLRNLNSANPSKRFVEVSTSGSNASGLGAVTVFEETGDLRGGWHRRLSTVACDRDCSDG
jgi:hypothetical protein